MAIAYAADVTTITGNHRLGHKTIWAVPFLVFLLAQGGMFNVRHLQRFYLSIIPIEMHSWAVDATSNDDTSNITAVIGSAQLPAEAGNAGNTVTDTSRDPPSPTARSVNISIVVELAGELGNHLSRLAHGYVIQRILWDDYGIQSHFVLQHQNFKKWVKPARDLRNCFSNFRSMDFTLGNSEEFRQRMMQQQQWLGESNISNLVFTRNKNIHTGLNYLAEILAKYTPPTTGIDSTANISLPFIISKGRANWNDVDAYFEGLKSFFAFDETICCKTLPGPDEHVFHYRNFRTELRKVGIKLGFEEISPDQSVELLQGATKVAITTRFDNKHARAYLDTFIQQGWQARIVSGQTGPQDFCFLQHANHLLAGIRSTFALWASFLGDAKNVTLYKMNTTETRNRFGAQYALADPQFNTSQLRDRIRFVTLTP